MDKHIDILTKLLIWTWNYTVGQGDWDNGNKSRKQRIVEINIYNHLKDE